LGPGPPVAGAVDLGGVGDPEPRDGLPTEADAGGELLGQADGLGAVLGPELDRPERGWPACGGLPKGPFPRFEGGGRRIPRHLRTTVPSPRPQMVRPPSWCSRERPTRCQAPIAGGVDGSTIPPSAEFSASSRRVAISPNSTPARRSQRPKCLLFMRFPSNSREGPVPTNRGGMVHRRHVPGSDHRGGGIRPSGEEFASASTPEHPTNRGGRPDHRGRIIRPSRVADPTNGEGIFS
jgi:hypothetical protein